MEDDLVFFFSQMEEDLPFVLGNSKDFWYATLFCPNYLDEIWKTTSILLKMEDALIFLQMEDKLNTFENGRRPHIFFNGRRFKFCSRQPRELIFGMQPYFDPTR
jgi:hypothetical protein